MVIRKFNGNDILPQLIVRGNKRWFSSSKFTFMNMTFRHHYEVNNKCFIEFFFIFVAVKEPKQYIPPKKLKIFVNIFSNKVTNINLQTLDKGAVPK